MADYKTYLASSILTEDKIITYRLLSRALKVNVNAAKEMLYDFHRIQNGKKPGTIHATYLISGTKRRGPETPPPPAEDGEDTHMQSSPFFGSSVPQPQESAEVSQILSIILVKEEDLEEVRSQFEHISSIHIYSIGPHPLQDLQTLSDITRQVHELTSTEDPLETAPQYGTIISKNVRRRKGQRPPPPPAPVATPPPTKAPPTKAKAVEPKPAPAPKHEISSTAKDFFAKSNAKPKTTTKAAASNPSGKESTPNPPPTLKRDSSSIFKSFAKAKPKLKREGTDSSVPADSPAISAAEDSPMRDVSNEEDEEETYVPPAPASKEIVERSRKERKENEERLRAMMDESDEEDEKEEEVKKEPEVETLEEEETKEVEKEKEASVEKEVPPVVSGGRRRGKRRVMKKKTVKDEEGYLVTKEEPVWESYSEDEPKPLPKPKIQMSSGSTKPKKGAAKAGQGNIMSFFGKK